MTVKHYSAPWGRRVRLITGLLACFLLGLAATLPLVLPADRPVDAWVRWLVPLVLLAILGGTALWSIRGYTLTDDALLVRRSFWVNRIPLARIETIGIDPRACEGAWKTVGNDGLFAMHGRFRSRRLGKFQAYVTDPANAVVLRVPGDTIVISPEHPRQFVNELHRRLECRKERR
jgi:hypothetical protein